MKYRQITRVSLSAVTFLGLIVVSQCFMPPPQKKRPNIVLILADDLGRADVGFTEGNLQTPTPTINKLAYEGIILNRHYSMPTCGPSRAALMASKYPYQTGMFTPIAEGEPWGLPLKFKIMPQYFKDLGYQTVALGKWHLGQHKKAFLPTHRGFDYWMGYGSGNVNLFNYSAAWWDPVEYNGRDFYENDKFIPEEVLNNHYLPDLLVEKAEQKIYNADPNKPLFMYFATPTPRCSQDGPLGNQTQFTMPQYLERPPIKMLNAKFAERRKQLAQIQALDDQVRRIVEALRNKGILDNTIIAFMSDNGAADISQEEIEPSSQRGINHGSNWPMRHSKAHVFEGGVRTPAFIWSPLIKQRGRISNDLFHLIDWLPTLYEAAGGNWAPELPDPYFQNSVSQWKALNEGTSVGKRAPRNALVVDLTPAGRRAYIQNALDRSGNVKQIWKMIQGPTLTKKFMGWTRTEGTSAQDPMTVATPASANCKMYPAGTEVGEKCNPNRAPCLFDLLSDPCEARNLATSQSAILDHMVFWFNATFAKSMVPSERKPFDPLSHPDMWSKRWVPWMDRYELGDDVAAEVVPYSAFNPPEAF